MTYYLHKVSFSSKNSTFGDGKIWPGSGSALVCLPESGLASSSTAGSTTLRKMTPTLYLPALILQQVAERWKPLLLGCSLLSPCSSPLPHIKLILSLENTNKINANQKKLGVLVYKLYHHFKSKRHTSFVLRKTACTVGAQAVFFFNKQVSKACGNHTLFRT